MISRDRHTPDHGPTQPALSDSSMWGEWYQRASPVQQQDALKQAVAQGVLFAHQLAAPARPPVPRRPLLSALLTGSVGELEPLHPPEVECHDRELDRTQREAVARAVAAPDVFLLQGFPGTGKSRVLTEIILQAAQRGERVLFLAPTCAALDRVLERLGTRSAVCPVRCLTLEESPVALPASVARLTLAERQRFYRENTVPAARLAHDAARAAHEAWLRQQSPWTRLEELAARDEELAERLWSLTERRAGIAAEVDRACAAPIADPFRARWDACANTRTTAVERLDSQLAEIQAELDTTAAKQGHVERESQEIRPLVEARQGGRIWSGAWWRAVLRGGLAEQARELEARRSELQTARLRLEHDLAARRTERAAVEERHAAECRSLRDEEIARREAELDAEIAAVSRERDTQMEPWRLACQALESCVVPAETSRQAVASARAEWERLRVQHERQASAAELWLRAVEEGLQTFPEKLAACANVVAATTTALPGDAHFGDRNGTPGILFDLLVLDEAHLVTESEFAAAARRARRWVLAGEPQPDDLPASPRRVVTSTALRPGFFQRLWQNLHADPHHLPYVWTRREGRLLCRLRPIPAEHERWLECEPVVDRPDVELRILTVPRQQPQVVEVVFPDSISISEAKRFLFRELDELAVQTRGRGLCWIETAEELVLELAPDVDPHALTVPLGDGVQERVICASSSGRAGGTEILWDTSRLQFERAAGWTREKAEQWVAERLRLRSLGRTIQFTVPYRLAPSLAQFLSELLFGGVCQPASVGASAELSSPPVEFVAVPSLASLESRNRAGSESPWNGGEHDPMGGSRAAVSVRTPRLRSVKGGAGLEMDLADNRPLEHLPADLRAVLPRNGLVNYLEARALVKRLETLVHDPAFGSACERWRRRPSGPCESGCASPAECACPRPDRDAAVAVMALYPAQVELLRHLIQRSPTLASSSVTIEVGAPSAFGQRECLLALLSLTRSHGHRAVSYGEHPHALPLALTRAASGLILFGDPGTLARRSQWRGALDHLDEAAARREAGLVEKLVQYLQGHGSHPSAFHVQEGSGV